MGASCCFTEIHIPDFTPLSASCERDDCESIPLCYNYKLNTGPLIRDELGVDVEGRLHSSDFVGLEFKDTEVESDFRQGRWAGYINFTRLELEDYGIPMQQPGTEGLRTRAFFGFKAECDDVNSLGHPDYNRGFIESMKTIAENTKNTLLTCDFNSWKQVEKEVLGEVRTVYTSVGNQPAKDTFGQPYPSRELRVFTPLSEGGWAPGWSQGWCDKETASHGKCDENLPGGLPEGTQTGIKGDGSLFTDFSHGVAGEFGAAQFSNHHTGYLRRWEADEYYNEGAVVTDPAAPEEGNVFRFNVYVRRRFTRLEPDYLGATIGALVTTRKFASGSYEVRAKVPKANGFIWAFWVYHGGADSWADRRIDEECAIWQDTVPAGAPKGVKTCGDVWPTSSSPFWIDASTTPGGNIPPSLKQIPTHQINVEVPPNYPQTCTVCGPQGRRVPVAEKYNSMSINNHLYSTDSGLGTEANIWLAASKDLIGDGKYHDYRFDWHTADENGKMHVDHYVDGVYVGSNDMMVPFAAGRLWIALRYYDDSQRYNSGLWNGLFGAGSHLPLDFQKPIGSLQLYEQAYVSSVRITPFYEEGDITLPSPLDQPGMNREVPCTEGPLECGTDPIVPYRTANFYPLNENGTPEAPCCGAICMSGEAAEKAGMQAGEGTTDPDLLCPPLENTVPGGRADRQGGCRCKKGPVDEHGDPTWSPDEYDSTCTWLPDKMASSLIEAEDDCNPNQPHPLFEFGYEDLGCRFDPRRVCLPPGVTREEGNSICQEWVENNCGEAKEGSWWEAYPTPDMRFCEISVQGEGEYYSYTALTKYLLKKILDENYANSNELPPRSCVVDLETTPIVLNEDESCFDLVGYCAPTFRISMYDVKVLSNRDIHGNLVCVYRRRFGSFELTDNVNPGYAGGCDVDYTVFMIPCLSDNDCSDWVGQHCDEPDEFFRVSCDNYQCSITRNGGNIGLAIPPVPLCYTESETPEVFDTHRWSCDWDFIRYPPCASGPDDTASCHAWITQHCSEPDDVATFQVISDADQNGRFACDIRHFSDPRNFRTKECNETLCLPTYSPEPLSSPSPLPLQVEEVPTPSQREREEPTHSASPVSAPSSSPLWRDPSPSTSASFSPFPEVQDVQEEPSPSSSGVPQTSLTEQVQPSPSPYVLDGEGALDDLRSTQGDGKDSTGKLSRENT